MEKHLDWQKVRRMDWHWEHHLEMQMVLLMVQQMD
jgi:hypothetical protein